MRRLSALFYPSTCLLCGAPGAGGRDLCRACEADLPLNPEHCDRCALPLPRSSQTRRICGRCLTSPPAYRRVRAPFVYAPPLDYLIKRFKFDGRLECAPLLGELLSDQLRAVDTSPGLLLPVPLHPARLRQRGFNQSALLARRVAAALQMDCDEGIAVRRRATSPQSKQNAADRQRNVRGAFALRRDVRGLRIVLVDDVVTTGATVSELARVILRGGACEVQVWCLARANPPGSPLSP